LFIWRLLPELSRAGIERLPTDSASAMSAANQRSWAAFAAVIGMVRGDLWAQSSFTYSDLLWGGADNGAALTQTRRQADKTLENALDLAPHQSGAWLLLAGLTTRDPSPGFNAREALKMSYYTGPSEWDYMPLRLRLMARLGAFDDAELQQFASRDLRSLITRKQIAAIVEVYREASPDGKRFIAQAVATIDRSVLDVLGSAAHDQIQK
jgi:hypothetical protein